MTIRSFARTSLAALLFVSCYLLVAACGERTVTAPFVACGDTPIFTVLPVPESAILAATPIGNLGPPGHTIPTDHVGIYLTGVGITLSSPGNMRLTGITRTSYLVSPSRQGKSDYSITAYICDGFSTVIGHIQTVNAEIEAQLGNNCQSYSTVDETVQQCSNFNPDVSLEAGEIIGTVGGQTAGAFDLGVYDTESPVEFVNPSRFSSLTRTAVCPYDPFAADLRAVFYAKLGGPGLTSSGEDPRCGTMNVDIAGTARGVWVLQSNPVNQSGDESSFAVLAPHPLYQQSGQAFSLGPSSLLMVTGPGSTRYPVLTSGRVNRRFSDITEDGLIYCYVWSPTAVFSYYVRLDPGPILTIDKVSHGTGAGPCSNAPSSWVMGVSAVRFVR